MAASSAKIWVRAPQRAKIWAAVMVRSRGDAVLGASEARDA